MAQNDKLDEAVGARLARLRRKLDEERLHAILVTMIHNVRYLSGFTGSTAALVISGSQEVILVDPRYTLQASEECGRFEIREHRNGLFEAVADVAASTGVRRIGFEADDLSYSGYWKLRGVLWAKTQSVATRRLVDDLRTVKDSQEIELIKKAARITDACFEEVVQNIKPGLTERELALAIDVGLRSRGADKVAFDTIVAAGPRAALPHAQPSSEPFRCGQMVLMDFGAECGQYPSDITRTVWLGEPDGKQREVYDTVLGAQLKAIDAIRPGVVGKDVDAVAREYIAAAGFGEYFGHGLGHSLGRGVHDGPGLSRTSEVILEPGMVVTVEPGIYIPGWGGVRIEDDVLVTDNGCEILTGATKELLEL